MGCGQPFARIIRFHLGFRLLVVLHSEEIQLLIENKIENPLHLVGIENADQYHSTSEFWWLILVINAKINQFLWVHLQRLPTLEEIEN